MSTHPTEPEEPTPGRVSFGAKAVAAVAAIAVIAWSGSLIVIPVLQGRSDGLSAFGSICRALGLRPPLAPGERVAGPSAVVWDAQVLAQIGEGNAARGEKLASDTCVSCHNPNGLSADPAKIPALAGQTPHVIYKQLADIKSGARANPDMLPLLEKLDENALADLATYYASLPARNADIREPAAEGTHAADLVLRGDSARGLPPCAACHDLAAGGPIEAPNLVGQYPGYVSAQLHAYASGARRNDVFGRMRTIAAKLSDTEIAELSAYYNARH